MDDGTTYGYFTDAAFAYHPARLVDGVMVDLGCPTQAGCIGVAANRHGTLAGQIYHDDAQFTYTAAVYQDGAWTDLGSLGGSYSFASGINARGKVVGAATTRNRPGYMHAFLWNAGTMRDLHTLGGPYSIANGINDLDVVAGASEDANGVLMAATWSQGAWTPLAPLVENLDGFTLDQATAITDDGRILVNTIKDNFAHAIVLTPVTR